MPLSHLHLTKTNQILTLNFSFLLVLLAVVVVELAVELVVGFVVVFGGWKIG